MLIYDRMSSQRLTKIFTEMVEATCVDLCLGSYKVENLGAAFTCLIRTGISCVALIFCNLEFFLHDQSFGLVIPFDSQSLHNSLLLKNLISKLKILFSELLKN